MKYLPILLLLAIGCASEPQSDPAQDQSEATAPPVLGLSVTLSREDAGADPLGMRHYVLAYLKAGNATDIDQVAAQKLQADHLKNIQRMADAGQLVLAGPFLDGGDVRGLYIFNTASLDSAKAWTSTDPAIIAGVLAMELHPWYGSAAFLAVNELHEQLAEQSFAD